MMQRKQFTFYRSFLEAIQALPKKEQLPFALALIVYALDGDELPLSGSAASAFCIVKPILDNARRKAENGKAGGSKPKQNESKPKQNEANPGLLCGPYKQEKGQEKEQVKEQDKDKDKDKDEDEDEDPPPPLPGGSVVGFVQGVVGELSPRARGELEGFARDMGAECVRRALDAARDAGKPTWAYVRGVLRRKQTQGVRTAADWDRLEQQREYSRQGGDTVAGTPRDVQPSPERARKNADWLEGFLSDQAEGRSPDA